MQRFGRMFGALALGSAALAVLAEPAAAAAKPNETAQGSIQSPLGSYLAGRLARGLNDTENAALFYRRALANEPNNRRIVEHAFLMEATEGHGDRATKLARRLVKFDNTHRLAQLWLGLAAFRDGSFAAADRHFAAAASGPIGELTSALARGWTAAAGRRKRTAMRYLGFSGQADWARFYLRYHRALVSDLIGDRRGARENYAALFNLDSRTPRVTTAYAQHALKRGDFRLAQQIISKNLSSSGGQQHPSVTALAKAVDAQMRTDFLITSPRDGLAEVFYGLGDALTTEGGMSLGAIYLQMALYLKPDFPYALAGLASVYESTRQYARANETYAKIAPDNPLRTLIDIRRARNLDSLDKVDEAKAVLTKLLADADAEAGAEPKKTGTLRSPRLDALRGIVLPDDGLRPGQRGEAVRALQTALGLVQSGAGGVDGAYGPATRRAVRAFQVRSGLGADGVAGPGTIVKLRAAIQAAAETELARLRSGATSVAEAGLRPVVRLRVYEAIANMMRSRKRYKEAITYYDKIIAMIPMPASRHWTYWYARGTSHERANNWPSAERDLLKAMELNPDQPLVLNYLGYSWVDQNKNLARGLELISRAVQLKPDDGYIVDSLGWAYFRLGRYAEAVQQLERAVELKPEDPILNDHLGDALWHVGRKREARFQWELALTLKPEQKTVDVIRKKLLTGLTTNPAERSIGLPKSEEKAKSLGKRAATETETRP